MAPESEYEEKFWEAYGKELEKIVDQENVREKIIKPLKDSINKGVKYANNKFIAELKDDNILAWSGKGHPRRTKEDAKESLFCEILRAKGIYVANPPKSTTCGTESVAPSTSSHRTTNPQKNANKDPEWYPIGGVKPRKYQEECVEKIIKEGNMLINLDTGMGKTLIASMATNWKLGTQKGENKKNMCVALLVPTRALVTQQCEYMKKHCHINGASLEERFVKEVAGMQVEDWDKRMWREAIDGARILVGTPEPFRKAMCDLNFITPQDFSLLIFDEAHHCIKNSPMANILRRVQEEEQRDRPLNLGLTGSWLNGRLSNADEKLKILLKLMDAKMHVPDIAEEYKKDDATYTKVEYSSTPKENNPDVEKLVLKVTEEVISGLSAMCKDVEKSEKRSLKVFTHLGVEGWLFFLEHALLNEIICQSKNASKSAKFKAMANSKIRDVEYLKSKLKEKIIPQQQDDIAKIKACGSPLSGKVTKLVELIQDLSQEDEEYRIIVFVEEISISLPLQKILNSHIQGISCTAVTGVNSMDDETRLSNIRRFREGAYKIMVATASLEEGLDVSACNHVISFDSIATVKSHIQKSGRARAKDAQIWYFENDPEIEKLRANEMQRCAKNIKKSDTDNTTNFSTEFEFPFGHYPFKDHSNGMTVTLLTAKQTFHEYIAAVVKQQFNPYEALYKYDGEKRLQKLLIPTPKGVLEVSEKTIRDMWGMTLGKDPSNLALLHPDCKPKKGGWEERQYVMTAVIKLVQKGFIGDNKATDEAKFETMLHDACKQLIPENQKMRFRNQYNVNAFAHAQGKFRAGDGKGKNAREQLLEMVQKFVKVTDKNNIKFQTEATPGNKGFLSRVIIVGSETYAGMEPRPTKKEAEEDAAFIAVEHLRNSWSSAKANNDETDGKTIKKEDDDIDENGDKLSKKNDHIDEAPSPSRSHFKEQKEPDEEPDKTPTPRISEAEENSAWGSPRNCASVVSKKEEKEQEAPQDTFHSCHDSSTGFKEEEEKKSRHDGDGASTVASLMKENLAPVRAQDPRDLDAAESTHSAPITSVSRRAPSSAASSKRPRLVNVKLAYGKKSQVKKFATSMTIRKISEECCPKDLKGKEVRLYHNDIQLHMEIEIGDITDDAELYGAVPADIVISLEFREHVDFEDDW